MQLQNENQEEENPSQKKVNLCGKRKQRNKAYSRRVIDFD